MAEVKLYSNWPMVIEHASMPELVLTAQDAKSYIDGEVEPPGGPGVDSGGCPVNTGNMRDSSYAQAIEEGHDTGVYLTVDLERAPYAKAIIEGTSERHGNHYLDRATKYAIERLNARNGGRA